MIGFIGGGNMAEAIIKGIRGKGQGASEEIIVSEPNEARRNYLEQTYNIKTSPSNRDIASSCDIIFLAVKPQNIEAVLDEISDVVTDKKTVVSIAAGITLSYLESKLKTKQIIRVMPNTPALVQEGLMDAVTALSGSGPAFIALFIEAMIEAGEKMEISRTDAAELAVQTLLGTARLLDTGMPPEKLRQMVTSPGGTTAAGLKVFEEKGFKSLVEDALFAAKKRAEELGRAK